MVDVRGLDPRFSPSIRLTSVKFLTYVGEEIERISCKKITNPNTFDSLLHPNIGGLYDPALGPCDKQDLCGTCGLNYVHCPGHLGHIPLPLPVYHPVFFMHMYSILRGTCWNCHRFLCTPYKSHLLLARLKLLELGLLSDASDIENVVGMQDSDAVDKMIDSPDSIVERIDNYVKDCKRKAEDADTTVKVKTKNLVEFKSTIIVEFIRECSRGLKKCIYCSAPIRTVRQENHSRIFLKALSKKNAETWKTARGEELKRRSGITQDGKETDEGGEKIEIPNLDTLTKQSYVTPLEVKEHISEIWGNQKSLLNAIVGCVGGMDERAQEEGGVTDLPTKRCGQNISPLDVFFLEVIPVPPSRFRPIAQLGDKRFENPQTANLHRVLTDTMVIHGLMMEKKMADGGGEGQEEEGGGKENSVKEVPASPKKKQRETRKKLTFPERLQIAWIKLQTDVNCLMDSTSDKALNAPSGIKQILEKKEGLFRKHMMGKRVDFAARSVISPDPYINMDEIGVPMVFATKLTYPQPVTHWNVKELRQAVINGPKVHPGATHVQNEDGSVVLLSASNSRQRVAIAKKLLTPSKDGKMGGAMKKVFRHLKNGDILLVNRQPTLHKPSIMAHKARVLPGEKTLRLHYANCKSYNADFDGDEMNAHFPQNELARAEGYSIVSTHHQYLVPKDGTPLSGLIQDHVVSGLLMTIRGRVFSRLDYMHLIFSALPEHHRSFMTLPPCIVRPDKLWSGKQVLSTLLLNIVPEGQQKLNLTSRAKIAVKEWSRGSVRSGDEKRRKKLWKKMKYNEDSMSESEVVFCQGELMCGVLDKSQFGASQYGFVHSCYELYGGAVANLLLSALGRLFTTFLQLHGFTLGVEDILVQREADKKRRSLMSECKGTGPEAAAEALGLEDPANKDLVREKFEAAHRSSDPTAIKTLDYFMKKKTDHFNNSINTACVPAGLHKPFPSNCLQLMVQSGAKGSTVNCMQISCLLGQIELEGQRPPLMASGRFLPSFLPYDPSPRAGGFVDGRFLTGIRPQEYFFHCMAGREGLVDTAVKTSRSGYLQRCLIKHLEGLCVSYDMSVRDCDGSVVQFLYGEDGMDIAKTRFLTEKQFPFLADNYKSICRQLDPKSALAVVDSTKAIRYQKKIDRWIKRNDCSFSTKTRSYRSGFLEFSEKHLPEMEAQYPNQKRNKEVPYRTKAELEMINLWYGMSPMARDSIWRKYSYCPIPVNAQLNPDRHFGSISEKMAQKIKIFMEKNPGKISPISGKPSQPALLSQEKFESLVYFKCLRALADPGEAVGLLAAQSIGEPSTQMTLNTFHFAGRGEMNVTLGIPRLREILMTASPNIKTPSMDVPLLPGAGARVEGEKLKRRFTRVCLNQVLEKTEVWESIAREKNGHRHRLYKVRLSFLPHKYYKDDFVVSPEGILAHVEGVFLKRLITAVNREIKIIRQKRLKSVSMQKERELERVKKSSAENSELPDEDEDDNADLSEAETDSADASTAKLLSKKQQHATYEGPGESDEEAVDMDSIDHEFSDDEKATKKGKGGRVKMEDEDYAVSEWSSDEYDDSLPLEVSAKMAEAAEKSAKKKSKSMDKDRVKEVVKGNGPVMKYRYDASKNEWCEVTLKFPSLDAKVMLTSVIERVAGKSVVWETPHIKKGFLLESNEPEERGLWYLKTDGVNLQELWRYCSILDLNKVYTNNIHAMANTYGIEAACKAIIKEISGVFKVYGIAVDYRHLSLIADYMTYEGSYKAFNRIGMESNSSPFQKMSFETTMHFLKNATISGETDHIQSPSACLVAGRIVKGGTGSFELLQKLNR